MTRVVIVGGGISGLSLAYRLEQRSPRCDVQILEKATRLGGKVGTIENAGFRVETGPNGFLANKTSTFDLCADLGLTDQLVRAAPEAGKNRYLFDDHGLRRLPAGPLEFLRSDLLSWRGKLDLAREWLRPPRRTNGDESIAAFARRRIGPEAAKVLVDAIVTGIHAGDPELLSAASCFPRLVELERAHGSVLRGLLAGRPRQTDASATPKRTGLWSLRDGLGTLIERLAARLRHPPMLGAAVTRLVRDNDGWSVHGADHLRVPADIVVLACPAHEQAAIVADLDAELAERLRSIAYNRVAVIGLGYRRTDVPMDVAGFGYIAPQRLRRDILGVLWCSSIYPGRAPDGAVLLRVMAGGWHRPEVAGWDDDRLLAAIRAELRLAMGITADPIFQHIIRWNRAIPQYQLGHAAKVEWLQERAARYPGLLLAGNAFHGVALNECTEQAAILADRIHAET